MKKKLFQKNTLYDNPQRLGLPVKGVENLQNAEKTEVNATQYDNETYVSSGTFEMLRDSNI